ncbi:hypothetical protein LCGC14_1875840 [marine sediment metagenome]|uniref:Endonuclease GajA/Old nuclease/RecF-like AAA domain-containing protein n=1 Tax=marine sediment metagenome TaxID=412755 RepID=A0A0F9G3W0_9ZZZZ
MALATKETAKKTATATKTSLQGVKSLMIKNFRCFDEDGVSIALDQNVTAFIGKNGSGKTAIIDALHLLLGQEYLPTRISENDFHCKADAIKDEIFIEAETTKPFFMLLETTSSSTSIEKVIVPCNKIRLQVKRREKAEKVLDDPFVITKTVVPIQGEISQDLFDDLSLSSRIRLPEKIEAPREEKGSTYYLTHFKLRDGKERTTKILDYFLTFNKGKLKECPKTYLLDKYRAKEISGSYSLMSKVLNDLDWRLKKTDVTFEENEKIAVKIGEAVDQKKKLISNLNRVVENLSSDKQGFKFDFFNKDQPFTNASITKNVEGKALAPNLLGSGFHIILSYALLQYVISLEKIPVILLVDEPEMHLHSDWQKKLYNTFVSQNQMQIIYTTQSENFISLENWRQIKIVNESEVGPTIETLSQTVGDGEATISAYLDDYSDRNLHISLFLKDNLELLFTEKCIIVEGPAEKYALPRLLE